MSARVAFSASLTATPPKPEKASLIAGLCGFLRDLPQPGLKRRRVLRCFVFHDSRNRAQLIDRSGFHVRHLSALELRLDVIASGSPAALTEPSTAPVRAGEDGHPRAEISAGERHAIDQ